MPEPSQPELTKAVPPLPPRPAGAHKGDSGRVAIIAGSRGMSGAAILAGLGALRGGAGLVRVLMPESVQPIVAASEPCLMTVALPETKSGQLSRKAVDLIAPWALDWATAVALGPGLGSPAAESTEIHRVAEATIRAAQVPIVVDADGLNAFPQGTLWEPESGSPLVVTPHPGEMARLREKAGLPALSGADDDTRLRLAHGYACTGKGSVTVVLKGHRTIVCTRDHAYINTTGNPGMATGGMGDVLTGLIAALLGQGLDAFAAARLGVYVHGLAGDYCKQHIGPLGYTAREVADGVPAALSEASRPRIGFV